MDGRKFAIATLAGGVTLFVVGYLVYGLALASFLEQHMLAGIQRSPPRYIVLFIGQLATAALLATVIGYWARVAGAAEGAKAGALLGFLVALSVDLTVNATSLVYHSLRAVAVDVFAFTIVMAIGGAVVGAALGRRS
jgi:hypothetical protein